MLIDRKLVMTLTGERCWNCTRTTSVGLHIIKAGFPHWLRRNTTHGELTRPCRLSQRARHVQTLHYWSRFTCRIRAVFWLMTRICTIQICASTDRTPRMIYKRSSRTGKRPSIAMGRSQKMVTERQGHTSLLFVNGCRSIDRFVDMGCSG
jgi:hypothetical protein